ncbi:MAG: hypothetical protein NVSMB70_10170 [Chamaesiphon sp.]
MLGMSACSTTPVTRSQAKVAAIGQILAPEFQRPIAERNVPVLLIRDAGFMGSFIDAIVAVDGAKLVTLKPEQSFEFYLSAGSHVFSVIPASNPLGEPMGETDIDIKAGGSNNFRLRLVSGDGPRIERSSQIDK